MSFQLGDVLREEKRMIIIRGLLARGFSCCFQQEYRKGGSASEEIT